MAAVLGVLTATTCAAAIAFAATTVFRRFVPARVSCWFCSAVSLVNYARRNGWVCAFCTQYNGFDSEGNCNNPDVLAAMHGGVSDADSVSPLRYACPGSEGPRVTDATQGLCQQCNINQKLKITQLSLFEPKSATAFDSEVEDYARHLESTYRLCRQCEAFVHQTLGQQDASLKPKLLSWRLERNRNSFKTSPRITSPSQDLILRIFIALASLVIFAHGNGFDVFPASGGFSEAVATVTLIFLFNTLQSAYNSTLKMTSLASWALLFSACTLRRYGSDPADMAKSATPVLTLLCLATSLGHLGFGAKRGTEKAQNSRPKYRGNDSVLVNSPHDSSACNESATSDSLNRTLSEANFEDCMQIPDHEVHYGSRSSSALDVAADRSSTGSGKRCDISALRIDDSFEQRPLSPSAFSIKRYTTSNVSGINFGGGQTSPSRRILLQPARFVPKHAPVARSSWVAGGYWQTQAAKRSSVGMSGELSRSSSQSSGFISYSAEQQLNAAFISLPNTRVNSVFGDAERSSVLSEPAYGASKSVFDHPPALDNGSVASSADRDSVFAPSPASASGYLRREGEAPVKAAGAFSVMDKHINIRISLYSLLLAVSIACNVSLAVYWATSQMTK